MPAFADAFDQIKAFWASRTRTQRWLLIASSVGTALVVGSLAWTIGITDYKPLFTGLEPADAQTLLAQLDASGIPHQTSADGKTISVPADRLNAARLQTAAKGEPHSGRMGFELFDNSTWGQTEFDEKVTYQRALEGELERTIQTLSDVEAARVHLVMPAESMFLDRERGAKASVIIKLKRDLLSRDSVLSISRLVAGAVDQLKPEDVSIIDADSERSFSVGSDSDPLGDGVENALRQKLLSTLEPIVGADSLRASVNVEFDRSATEENDEKYDPGGAVILNQQKTEDQAVDAPTVSGVPGTASNTPSRITKTSSPPKDTGTIQRSTSESTTYGVNRTQVHRTIPSGRIQRIFAAVVVDDASVATVENGKHTAKRIKRSQDELNRIQQLAEAALGMDPKRGDIITVENLSFQGTRDPDDILQPSWTDKLSSAANQYGGIARPFSMLVLFLLAYILVLRPVQRHALTRALSTSMDSAALEGGVVNAVLSGGRDDQNTDRAASLKQNTLDLIKQKPTESAKAVQAWLRGDNA